MASTSKLNVRCSKLVERELTQLYFTISQMVNHDWTGQPILHEIKKTNDKLKTLIEGLK